LSAIWR